MSYSGHPSTLHQSPIICCGVFLLSGSSSSPATCIHFVASPGMVAGLFLFLNVPNRFGVLEDLLLHQWWGPKAFSLQEAIPTRQPLRGADLTFAVAISFAAGDKRTSWIQLEDSFHQRETKGDDYAQFLGCRWNWAERGCFRERGEFVFTADPGGCVPVVRACTHRAGGRERLKKWKG